jgi:transposase
MKLYAGIDLHSRNNYIGIIDEEDKRLFQKRLPNRLDYILSSLEPFQQDLEGVVVESTYNWYWLVDGLMEQGYRVHLANPSAIKQYEGLKHSDDKWDSFWLAHMKRLNILPEGYIYPKEERPVRDLLRKRSFLVKQRTSHLLSFQSMVDRVLGKRISSNEIKKLKVEDVEQIFDEEHLLLSGQVGIGSIRFFNLQIREIEKVVKKRMKLNKSYQYLLTVPGIGYVLALTIMLEVGDIRRFPTVGDFSSYCRCVDSKRLSNGKKKGKGNSKNGNRYLSWAFVEAVHCARQVSPKFRKYYQKKEAQRNNIVAAKALSNKLSRACYYIIRDQVPFREEGLFC